MKTNTAQINKSVWPFAKYHSEKPTRISRVGTTSNALKTSDLLKISSILQKPEYD